MSKCHRIIPLPPVFIMGALNPNCAVLCAASVSSRFADSSRYFPSSFLSLFLFCRCSVRCVWFAVQLV